MAGNRRPTDPWVVAAVGAGALIGSALAAIGSWIGYSNLMVNHRRTLTNAIDAERRSFISGIGGALSYYASVKQGTRPLVLIHSINAAASAYEVKPIFDHYRDVRSVCALDLPGFGFSDRSNRVYSADLYKRAILDFIENQVNSDQLVDVVALSLGSEFVAKAALERPDLFHSLTLISPSGFGSGRGSQQAARLGMSGLWHRVIAFPLWSQALYDLLATPSSIKYFLKQSFEGEPDPGLVDYDYTTSHQPGARNAPLYFVSGKLFTPNIRNAIYEKLNLPVLVIHDTDKFVRFDTLPALLQSHPNWQVARVAPTKGLPQFEKLPETAAALDKFWGAIG